MSDYVVLWDGRKNGPGGALLFAPEQATTPPAEVKHFASHYGEIRSLVRGSRSAFGDRWFTALELAAHLGLTTGKAHTEISQLLLTGEMERERKSVLRVATAERRRYRWVPR